MLVAVRNWKQQHKETTEEENETAKNKTIVQNRKRLGKQQIDI